MKIFLRAILKCGKVVVVIAIVVVAVTAQEENV